MMIQLCHRERLQRKQTRESIARFSKNYDPQFIVVKLNCVYTALLPYYAGLRKN